MRVEIRDDVLRRLAEDSGFVPKGWNRDVIRSFRKKLQLLDAAKDDRDVRAWKSLHLEKLSGDRAGTWSIRLNDQHRLILRFETDDAGRFVVILELADYH